MAPRSKKKTEAAPRPEIPQHTNLTAALLSKKAVFKTATFWIVGDTPLITHAWSQKAKEEMLARQVGATRAAREKRDPQSDFESSLYKMREAVYGFPATGIKNCFLSAAHKDKGIARSSVLASLFVEAEMVRVGPALAGSTCDMPLVRIYGSKPEMREDMVKIGSGLSKVASLAYRGQFTHWAMKINVSFNPSIITPEALGFIVSESGIANGLGEWRNEKKGMFGAFHLAKDDAETASWEAFAKGKGPLPTPKLREGQLKLAAE